MTKEQLMYLVLTAVMPSITYVSSYTVLLVSDHITTLRLADVQCTTFSRQLQYEMCTPGIMTHSVLMCVLAFFRCSLGDLRLDGQYWGMMYVCVHSWFTWACSICHLSG